MFKGTKSKSNIHFQNFAIYNFETNVKANTCLG